MRLYRIGPLVHLSDLSGTGASYTGGARWNRVGLPVIYMAFSPAVAMLEMANYIPSPRLVPKTYALGIYSLTARVSAATLSIKELPDNWLHFPCPAATQKIGSQWLESKKALLLRVPSSAVAEGLEDIAVINPLHPDIGKLSLESVQHSIYNLRAFSGT